MINFPPPPGWSSHDISEVEYMKLGNNKAGMSIAVAIFGFGNYRALSTSDGEVMFVKEEYDEAAKYLLMALRALPD